MEYEPWNHIDLAISEDSCRWGRKSSERVHLLLRSELLDETDGNVKDNNECEHSTLNVIIYTKRKCHGENENLKLLAARQG